MSITGVIAHYLETGNTVIAFILIKKMKVQGILSGLDRLLGCRSARSRNARPEELVKAAIHFFRRNGLAVRQPPIQLCDKCASHCVCQGGALQGHQAARAGKLSETLLDTAGEVLASEVVKVAEAA